MEGLMRFRTSYENLQILDDLEYYFNESGELRHMITKKPFVYNYYKNEYERNHTRYKILGDMITDHVYEILVKECGLERIQIPIDAKDEEPRSSFFMTKEDMNMQTSLLVLLQDRGVIRAGQWGQKVIIHHSLEKGTQIPYIKTALREYGSVMVLNPNDNFVEMKEEPQIIVKKEEELCASDPDGINGLFITNKKLLIPKRCSSSPEEHTSYIWDHFISRSTAKNIAFIAHGYGGLVFLDLLCKKRKEIMSKVSTVAFIDSRHHSQHQAKTDREIQTWMHTNCRSWVLSTKPLDRPTGSLMKIDCPKVSAGTENHELAPYKTLSSVFRFLTRSLKSRRTMLTRSATRNK
ncbi:hypothetical protein GDO86_003937 [Hymenochirus boettgeri]|uniref:Arb2 domain-containing protein n=1 Tax=Hymenochirus boettgeri TaxID=247094 RepID=A0A8T2KBR4_9PIPI|nr:hypothetical protein GDO86_003937 [Hymenochirus boettgeri]